MTDARKALASNETRTAEIHLKNLIQQQPDNVEGRQLLGEVLLVRGDPAGAEFNLRRALDLGADPKAIQLSLVRALVTEAKYADALRQITVGPAPLGQDRLATLSLQGEAERGLGDYDKAERAFRTALEIDPRPPGLRTQLAAVLLETGQAAEGRKQIDAVLGDDPTFAPALVLRGNLEQRAHQYASAEATFQGVVDRERAAPAKSPQYSLALAGLVEAQLAQQKVEPAAANADALLAVAPKSVGAHYVKATVEVQQKKLDEAERRLENLVASVPDYWPAYRLLGVINVEQQQLGQAVMYLRAAVTKNPKDGVARMQLAQLYVRQGDIKSARQLLQEASQSELDDGLFLAFAGRASQQAGLQQQAQDLFDQSEQHVPQSMQELASVSSLYLAAGELDRAVRVLESTSFDDPKSEQLASHLLVLVWLRQGNAEAADHAAAEVVDKHPGLAWPLVLRGTVALYAGERARAHELFAKALAIEPKNRSALSNLARIAVMDNDPATAKQYLGRVLDANPKDTVALVGLAQLAAAQGDYNGALAWLDRVPVSAVRARLQGEVLYKQGKFADAADAFANAFDTEPSAQVAMLAYQAALRAGRKDPEAELIRWTQTHPQDPTAQFALGSIAMTEGRHDAAIERYQTVLALQPDNAVTLNNMAWIYSERGDPRAFDYAKRAYVSAPNNPAIADTLGWLHVQRGKADQGLPLLEQAAAGMPTDKQVLYHWAVALADTGNRSKASDVLTGLVAASGDFPEKADAEKRLAALRASRR